ncbi:unnamed protein product, partial [Scytosiphon promiscuus]
AATAERDRDATVIIPPAPPRRPPPRQRRRRRRRQRYDARGDPEVLPAVVLLSPQVPERTRRRGARAGGLRERCQVGEDRSGEGGQDRARRRRQGGGPGDRGSANTEAGAGARAAAVHHDQHPGAHVRRLPGRGQEEAKGQGGRSPGFRGRDGGRVPGKPRPRRQRLVDGGRELQQRRHGQRLQRWREGLRGPEPPVSGGGGSDGDRHPGSAVRRAAPAVPDDRGAREDRAGDPGGPDAVPRLQDGGEARDRADAGEPNVAVVRAGDEVLPGPVRRVRPPAAADRVRGHGRQGGGLRPREAPQPHRPFLEAFRGRRAAAGRGAAA